MTQEPSNINAVGEKLTVKRFEHKAERDMPKTQKSLGKRRLLNMQKIVKRELLHLENGKRKTENMSLPTLVKTAPGTTMASVLMTLKVLGKSMEAVALYALQSQSEIWMSTTTIRQAELGLSCAIDAIGW